MSRCIFPLEGFLLCVLIIFLGCTEEVFAESNVVRVFVTDFGINRWKPHLKTGDDLARAAASDGVFSEVGREGEILVVMGDRNSNAVKMKLRKGLSTGTRNFEVQLIERISGGYYLFEKQQDKVAAFGAYAYKLLNSLECMIIEQGLRPRFWVVVGSNGTSVFLKNVRWVKDLIYRVVLVDGRADEREVDHAVFTLGPRRVFLVVTHGDYPGYWETTIANHSVAESLSRTYGLPLFKWRPGKGPAHVNIMNPHYRPYGQAEACDALMTKSLQCKAVRVAEIIPRLR